jgi:hypothetical protein
VIPVDICRRYLRARESAAARVGSLPGWNWLFPVRKAQMRTMPEGQNLSNPDTACVCSRP